MTQSLCGLLRRCNILYEVQQRPHPCHVHSDTDTETGHHIQRYTEVCRGIQRVYRGIQRYAEGIQRHAEGMSCSTPFVSRINSEFTTPLAALRPDNLQYMSQVTPSVMLMWQKTLVVPGNAPAIAVNRYNRYRLHRVEQSQFHIFMGMEIGMELECGIH